MSYRSKNMAKVKVSPEREIHVRRIWVKGGRELISIRDFIPTTETDGRGVTFPLDSLGQVIEALQETHRALVGDRVTDPGASQGRLL